jgi:hypothetical protein
VNGHALVQRAGSEETAYAERSALLDAVLGMPPGAWREEALRALFATALTRREEALAARVASALPPMIALEERLAELAARAPLEALADDGFPFLSVTAQRRILTLCTAHLDDVDDAGALVRALRAALDWMTPSAAFVQAMTLVRACAAVTTLAESELVQFADVQVPSSLARADLLRAVAAALAARNVTEPADRLNAEARAVEAAEWGAPA